MCTKDPGILLLTARTRNIRVVRSEMCCQYLLRTIMPISLSLGEIAILAHGIRTPPAANEHHLL